MSATTMISAIEQAIALANAPADLVRNVDQLEGEVTAILSIVDIALGALRIDDGLREDLEEIRKAATLAIARIEQFRERTRRRSQLRLV